MENLNQFSRCDVSINAAVRAMWMLGMKYTRECNRKEAKQKMMMERAKGNERKGDGERENEALHLMNMNDKEHTSTVTPSGMLPLSTG